MKRYDNNVRDLRGNKPTERARSEREGDTLKYGKPSQSPMAENVGDINLHRGAGDDTDTQTGTPDEPVAPRSRRAADINGVEWRGE
jgi:hypothetical protein